MADRKEPPFHNDDSVGSFHPKLQFYETMDLLIETLTGTCFELQVSPLQTVISVKAMIQRLEGIPVAQQHLIWNSVELENEFRLRDYSIAEGCTLKLVLAMRGGPINTRRVSLEDQVKDMADLMGEREEDCEKSVPSKQVTFLLYQEGDQLNFFRVFERGDDTLTPVSESLSGGSVYNVYGEEEEEEEEEDVEGSGAGLHTLENSITMNKMKLLKARMEDMNINKKPKKSAKLKARPPTTPRPCGSSLGPPSTRRHRLFNALPQINPSHHPSAHLPPIRDHESTSPSPSAADMSISRRRWGPFTSPSCYMLQEEEPCESWPAFAKVRPPPKVSRFDVGSARWMRDCVYPQLPALSSRGQADGSLEAPDPRGDALGLGLVEEVGGLMEPTLSGALFGERLSDPLSLDVSTPPEEGLGGLDGAGALGVAAEYQLPSTSSLLSQAVGPNSLSLNTWALGPDTMTCNSERTQLGSSLHLTPDCPSSSSPSSSAAPSSVRQPPPQPFEFTGSALPPSLSVRPAALLETEASSLPLAASTLSRGSLLRGIKVDSPGKRPEVVSKSEARGGVTKMSAQACKEPLGSLSNSELLASLSSRTGGSNREGLSQSLGLGLGLPHVGASGLGRLGSMAPSLPNNIQLLQDDLFRQAAASYLFPNSLVSASRASSVIRRLGTPTYHLPPVKVPVGSKKKSSKHCCLCGKKTGLAASYECRCGNNFCATHRYAETHDCTYDYKSAGRRFLQETNPIISAPKLPKI